MGKNSDSDAWTGFVVLLDDGRACVRMWSGIREEGILFLARMGDSRDPVGSWVYGRDMR